MKFRFVGVDTAGRIFWLLLNLLCFEDEVFEDEVLEMLNTLKVFFLLFVSRDSVDNSFRPLTPSLTFCLSRLLVEYIL